MKTPKQPWQDWMTKELKAKIHLVYTDPAASENQHQGDGRRNEVWQDEKIPLP